ncbi:hypothetical protein A3I34_01405 [Candidatus Jorgensenbacteria bacterium RIFCSPLOWO2_02_FULL_45_12]|uniref:Transcriptional repressor PaaX-like central Cas2-like domain-containing protein n=2 Tax=Candidatus Joergenseniibacteriota TaxID=1752739 RepID=A0A1F6BN87_9BACT|nr:MAG: hypothetical protein UX22_C0019G0005 [Candidatus Jorgensenbacteria bacterium GW2011_GWA2_45_9]OGG38303.1 MAG: hypothetical protein A3D55_02080 [Candidatus Jorgensenbacteria bacterium RIFCSPHIGHO2_02_FULL_45_20]OGG42683.1 MAG: hypothetical protein A3I34_01405 [Candidatus Jorgensenbacteria bacterium RIFCSPLOWO2_02_FULL_45_12]
MEKNEKKKKSRFRKEAVLFQLARAGEVTLETLFDLVVGFGEMMIAMGGATSTRESLRRMNAVVTRDRDSRADPQSKAAFSTMLSRLAKDGLIERSKDRISITKSGSKTLESSRIVSLKPLPDEKNILVIFDIPEKFSKKRQWIRYELRGMGFEMVQKSVWSGNVLIPESFLKDVSDMNLQDCVHIFEVTKHGTLKE